MFRIPLLAIALLSLFTFAIGCSSDDAAEANPGSGAHTNASTTGAAQPSAPSNRDETTGEAEVVAQNPYRAPERTFEDLLNSPDDNPDPHAFGGAQFGHPQHDDEKLRQAGIRKIEGDRLTVYTDLPRGDVDDFPRIFSLAVPQWKEYFSLPDDKLDKWRMTVYVIDDKQLARRQGLIADDLPDFAHGYQRGFEMWVYEQPSDYYRRHLLLHEGTHAVMNTLLGRAGPPWYMEGVAELVATHRWDGEKLTLRYNPPDKEEAPYWGRVKIIRDDFDADQGMPLESVLNYDNRAHQSVNAYAWCWAACMFLDTHPQTQKAFREMQKHVRLPDVDFNRRFLEAVADGWNRIANEQWFLYVQQMEYGSDPLAAIVKYEDGAALPAEGAVVDVDAQGGWQSSGIEVQAGKKYTIRAAGRYTIAREEDGTPWPCEPGGVSIRYYNGRPLGELFVAVRRGEPKEGVAPDLSQSLPVGLRTIFTPNSEGTLYFFVNDSPAERDDNEGGLKVQVKAAQ